MAWMVFHIGVSVLHSATEVLMHAAIYTPLVYLLFRRSSARYFSAEEAAST
jgi:hypothetical protein